MLLKLNYKQVLKKRSFGFGLLMLLLLLSNILGAQQLRVDSRNLSGKSMEDLLKVLSNDYGCIFSYNNELVKGKQLPPVLPKTMDWNQLLSLCFHPLALDVKQVGNQWVIFFNEQVIPSYMVSGFISDSSSGEALIGAVIYDERTKASTVSNAYGFFSIKAKVGQQRLTCLNLGYERKIYLIELKSDTLIKVIMSLKAFSIGSVDVLARENASLDKIRMINQPHIEIQRMQKYPGFLGENDAIRNITLLPGVSAGEMSTGSLFVRGGSADQTFFVVDEAQLYDASHFGGFFSIFNPDAVNYINLYKSDIPPDKNTALSSVVEVRLREGNLNKWKIKGALGLISGRFSVEGPLVKEKASVLFAVRRTYLDQWVKLLSGGGKDAMALKFYFYDVNAKLNWHINSRNRIYASVFMGKDHLEQYDYIVHGNSFASMRWNHTFAPSLFSNISAVTSWNNLELSEAEPNEKLTIKSELRQVQLKSDFVWTISDSSVLHFGHSLFGHGVMPFSMNSTNNNSIYLPVEGPSTRVWSNTVYAQYKLTWWHSLQWNCGLRLGYWMLQDPSSKTNKERNLILEPSFSISSPKGKFWLLSVGANRKVQPLHQTRFGMLGLNFTRWVPASNDFPVEQAYNFFLNTEFIPFKNLRLGTGLYYRRMLNLVDGLQDSRIVSAYDVREFLHNSSARAYGFEFQFDYSQEDKSFTVAYDWSPAFWQIDGINESKPYPASFRREHNINVSTYWKLFSRIGFSMVWKWSTGTPFTPPTGSYQWEGRTYYSFDKNNINSQNLPNYHRLDISIDIEPKEKPDRRWKGVWNISVYNAYFNKNALGVTYLTPIVDDDGNVTTKAAPGFYYMYQFVPSISYRFEF